MLDSRQLLARPTVVPVLLHSFVMTVAAIAVILPAGQPSSEAIPQTILVWRRAVLPFSMAYWLFDLLFYCYPKQDTLIAVHHLAIMVMNWPIGDNAGAAALAALDPACNVVMCSATGYTLEATTFLLYVRWLLANVLAEHHWAYSATSALLLFSWVYLRMLYSPYFMLVTVGSSCSLSSPLAFYTFVGCATYTLMVFMSGLWLLQLLRHGLRAFLVFQGVRRPTSRPSSPSCGAVPPFGARINYSRPSAKRE